MDQNIVPQDYVQTSKIVRIEISVTNVILKTSASFRIVSFSDTNNLIKIDNIDLTTEEYNNWGADDDYIINLICQKLGYTPQSIVI